jgi:hypothetical protein
VAQKLRVVAAGLFEGVREDGEAGVVQVAAGRLPLLVGGLGEPADGAPLPVEPTAQGVLPLPLALFSGSGGNELPKRSRSRLRKALFGLDNGIHLSYRNIIASFVYALTKECLQ